MGITRLHLAAVLAAGAIAIAGCGDDDDTDGGAVGSGGGGEAAKEKAPSSGGGGQTLRLAADPGGALKFDKSSLTAKAGKVTIVMDNPSSLPHAVELEGNGVEEVGETVQKGGVSKLSADVKPGEYEYYCPVAGHKEGGMEGTLTVR
jgi:plastocyanin